MIMDKIDVYFAKRLLGFFFFDKVKRL